MSRSRLITTRIIIALSSILFLTQLQAANKKADVPVAAQNWMVPGGLFNDFEFYQLGSIAFSSL